MDTHSHSMRVLVRPAPTLPVPSHPPPSPTPPDPSASSPHNGVAVVGFVGKRHDDVACLINKIIDSHVFGSGKLDRPFPFEGDNVNPEIDKWFKNRKLSFYHDVDKGILYLQYSSTRYPLTAEESSETRLESDSVFEDHEFGDLQGLLFMFSVCHVIILIQEGSRFDTQMLKKFRILQAAKQAMLPFIRSQNKLPVTSRTRSSASSQLSAFGASFNNPSPGKTRGILNRNASTITLMSGLGSHSSLLPGQCTPVVLFVFIDDFNDIQHSSNMEEPTAVSSLNVSSSLSNSGRPGMPVKGSGSVVVLARPVNKSEGGLRKKLQSSLEAQIRFSIKKCRTLSGSESSHAGSRSGGISSSAPLFSLDASKAVSLVDTCSTQSGESLEFAIGLVEEVLDGKATSDSLLLESHQQNTNKDDILSVKEFMYRQFDILRGRGGMVASTNSGSATGVGMVAVAAAAAAASAASGKTVNAPELPSLEIWSSSCQLILQGLLSAKRLFASDTEANRTRDQGAVSPPGVNATSLSDPLESVISHLESGTGLNTRFSNLWCQKAFPVAKKVYLDELPPCYPSSQHEEHLKKALHALTLMVKGPAVQLHMKKLKDECTSIWSSGRQLCDAVSLTGKPCMHQRHDPKTCSTDENIPHSSGYVYLHACACGRSRQLRSDPFDYDMANVAHNFLPDCDKFLPTVRLPEQSIKGPIQPSSWNLIRVGSARYYDPSKGLLQSGFCATQKFLFRWTIFLGDLREVNHSLLSDFQRFSIDGNVKVETLVDVDAKTSNGAHSRLSAGAIQNGIGLQMRLSSDITVTENRNTNFGRGISNYTLKKPFSEVVSGSAAASSGFPPLFSRKQPLPDADRSGQKQFIKDRGLEKIGEIICNEGSQKLDNIASIDKALNTNEIASDGRNFGNPSHIGRNVVPVNMNGFEQIRTASSTNHVTVYVGFEHECPHGHRFILTLDHLNEPGSSCTVPEENVVPSSVEKSKDSTKLGKIIGHGKTRRQSNGIIMGGGSGKAKNLEKSKDRVINGDIYANKLAQPNRSRKEQVYVTNVSDPVKDLDTDIQSTSVDDGDCGFSLLNRSLPIYMNCPYCRDSMSKNDVSNIKFASTISQLQRIFVMTPSFPVLLAADPIIQFEVSSLPPSVIDREKKLQFSLGCPVILPPDSFLSLRLPFVYGVELEDGSVHSFKPSENQPQLTAWIMKGTALQVVSRRRNLDLGLVT